VRERKRADKQSAVPFTQSLMIKKKPPHFAEAAFSKKTF